MLAFAQSKRVLAGCFYVFIYTHTYICYCIGNSLTCLRHTKCCTMMSWMRLPHNGGYGDFNLWLKNCQSPTTRGPFAAGNLPVSSELLLLIDWEPPVDDIRDLLLAGRPSPLLPEQWEIIPLGFGYWEGCQNLDCKLSNHIVCGAVLVHYSCWLFNWSE